jgi:hypothetical protein
VEFFHFGARLPIRNSSCSVSPKWKYSRPDASQKNNIRYQHYSDSMADIPENSLVLAMLDKINAEE